MAYIVMARYGRRTGGVRAAAKVFPPDKAIAASICVAFGLASKHARPAHVWIIEVGRKRPFLCCFVCCPSTVFFSHAARQSSGGTFPPSQGHRHSANYHQRTPSWLPSWCSLRTRRRCTRLLWMLVRAWAALRGSEMREGWVSRLLVRAWSWAPMPAASRA